MGKRTKIISAIAVSMLIALALTSMLLYSNDNDGAPADEPGLGGLRESQYFLDLGYKEIDNLDDFKKIGVHEDYPAYGSYFLSANIAITGGSSFTGIGTRANPFTGTFDGNGFSFSGASVVVMGGPAQDEMSRSIFAYVGGNAKISNLGSVDNEFTIFAVSKYTYTSGMIGYVMEDSNIEITNCYYLGTGSGFAALYAASGLVSSAGGLVGYSLGNIVIRDSYSNGGYYAIDARGVEAYAGGLIGYCKGNVTIENSYNKSYIHSATTGFSSIGGLIGHMPSGTLVVTNCYNTRTLTIPAPDGSYSPKDHVGGIIGSKFEGDTTISQCYNSGKISAMASSTPVAAGGIIGTAGIDESSPGTIIIKDCYNVGSVNATSATARSQAGGILGLSATQATIENCYSAGAVGAFGNSDDNSYVGGIVGRAAYAELYNCYYLFDSVDKNGTKMNTFGHFESTPLIDGLPGVPREGDQGSGVKTASELAANLEEARDGLSVFFINDTGGVAGWDFDNIWTIVPGLNKGFPIFGISPPKYNVTFHDTMDNPVRMVAVLVDTAIPKGKIPLVMNLPGYNYAWYSDPERTSLYDFSAPVTGPLNLYLKYERIEGEWVNVTFYDETDEYITTVSVLYGTPIRGATIPATVSHPDYLAAWCTEPARENTWNLTADVTEPLELYLMFIEIVDDGPGGCTCSPSDPDIIYIECPCEGKKRSAMWILPVTILTLLSLIALGLLLRRPNELEIGEIGAVAPNGSQIMPTPWVKQNGVVLEAGKDFTYAYGENTAAGLGTVTITLGNTNKKVTVTFVISEKG